MTTKSKTVTRSKTAPLRGIRLFSVLEGADGRAVEPAAREPRRSPDRAVDIRLCPRLNKLSMRFKACGFTYVGSTGTEDPHEAALIGAAVRDAVEARLVATGVRETWRAVMHLADAPDATPTGRADLSLMMTVVAALVRSAPRAVAEATAKERDGTVWSARPVPAAVHLALR